MALGLAAMASAQTVQTLPSTLPASFVGNVFPFGNTTSANAQHVQFHYDGSEFGVNYPILIQRLRFRSTGAASGSMTGVTIKLSVSPNAWSSPSLTYAANLTPSKTVTVLNNATVNFTTLTAAGWAYDLKLSTPYLYDPSSGPLVFDWERTGTVSGGFTGAHVGNSTFQWKASRIYGPSGQAAAAGQTAGPNGYANAAEVSFVPAKGLYAGFNAKPVEGKSPLKVQFTDASFSSDAGGVTSWAWDLDGDNKVDSTLQNPVFTYTAKAFDTYFDVSLTVTDAAHPKSQLTRKQYIRVNPSTAKEEDFGVGTMNKMAPSPMEMPDFTYTYTAAATRGYFFQAPVQMIINGFEVPNETKQTQQAILLFKYPGTTKPTGSYSVTAADHLFFTTTAKADTVVRPKSPIIVPKGTWLGVLGGCHGGSGSLSNSYGNAGNTTVLGQPTALARLTFGSLLTTNGIGSAGTSTSPVGRVFLHVVGNTSTKVPELTSSARPILGTTPNLQYNSNIATAQGGILFLGSGRMPTPVKTPFGTLLIQPPLSLALPIPGAKADIPLPIPNDNNLKGVILPWQAFGYDIAGGYWGMTNGTEWYVGTK